MSNSAAPDGATREDLNLPGLNLDMLDADRLRLWAARFAEYGPDLTEWGSVAFVVQELRRIASGIEAEVRAVGELRERLRAGDALRVPLDVPAEPAGRTGKEVEASGVPEQAWSDLLAAPCVWCGYNGAGYWQAGTHSGDCPWRFIGGEHARRAVLREHQQEAVKALVSSEEPERPKG